MTKESVELLVDNLYNKLLHLPKPKTSTYGGTYYGSTELLSHVSNILTKTTSPFYDELRNRYEDSVVLRIGAAYDYADYKEEYLTLINLFKREYGPKKTAYDERIAVVTKEGTKNCKLIRVIGTSYSIIGVVFY